MSDILYLKYDQGPRNIYQISTEIYHDNRFAIRPIRLTGEELFGVRFIHYYPYTEEDSFVFNKGFLNNVNKNIERKD